MNDQTTAPADQPQEQPVSEPPAAAAPAPVTTFHARAAGIREAKGYDGTLTVPLLLELEVLLREPIDPKYIERTPPTSGKPYESTGVKSVQVQVDRMNDVLGAAHWRSLIHYAEGGTVCKAVVVVGNNLVDAKLDAEGNLERGDADILVVRDGWGGHSRGSGKGDILKGAETNTLKRVIARVGPGCDIYRLDYDLDTHGHGPEYQPGAAAAAEAQVGVKKATPGQQRMIRARASAVGVSDAQLCNIILRAAGSPLKSDSEANEVMRGGLLSRLPFGLVDTVLEGIKQGPPPAVIPPVTPLEQPASTAPPADGPPAATQPPVPSDLPVDPAAIGDLGPVPTADVTNVVNVDFAALGAPPAPPVANGNGAAANGAGA